VFVDIDAVAWCLDGFVEHGDDPIIEKSAGPAEHQPIMVFLEVFKDEL
jgi:hypothetical protein